MAIFVGMFLYTLIEYVYHRHAGHLGIFGKRILDSHRYHHQDPKEGGVLLLTKFKERLRLVVMLTFLFFCGFLLVFELVTSLSIMVGMILGYIYSESFHHAIHHRAPRNRFERWLWDYHYIHHFKNSRVNYGFTSPLWDFIFRTAMSPRPLKTSSRSSLKRSSTLTEQSE